MDGKHWPLGKLSRGKSLRDASVVCAQLTLCSVVIFRQLIVKGTKLGEVKKGMSSADLVRSLSSNVEVLALVRRISRIGQASAEDGLFLTRNGMNW